MTQVFASPESRTAVGSSGGRTLTAAELEQLQKGDKALARRIRQGIGDGTISDPDGSAVRAVNSAIALSPELDASGLPTDRTTEQVQLDSQPDPVVRQPTVEPGFRLDPALGLPTGVDGPVPEPSPAAEPPPISDDLTGLQTDIAAVDTQIEGLRERLAGLGLEGRIVDEITSLEAAGAPLEQLEGRLTELGIGHLTGDIEAILQDSGQIAVLEERLGLLGLPDTLTGAFADYLKPGGNIDLFRSELDTLDIPFTVKSDMLALGNNIVSARTALAGLQVPDALRTELEGLLGEGRTLDELKAQLSQLQIDPLLGERLFKRQQQARSLELALGGLEIAPDLKDELRNILIDPRSDLNILRGRLSDLQIKPDLAKDLTDRINQANTLDGVLEDIAGLPAQISNGLRLIYSEGGTLSRLRGHLSVVEDIPGNILTDLDDGLRTASQLSLAMRTLNQVGFETNDRIRNVLNDNIGLLTGEGGLQQQLIALGLPKGFSGELERAFDQVGILNSSFERLRSTGIDLGEDVRSILQDNMDILFGTGSDQGLITELERLKVPDGIIPDLTEALGEAEALNEALGLLSGPDGGIDQLNNVLEMLSGDAGILPALEQVGLDDETVGLIDSALRNSRELRSLMGSTQLDPELSGEISDAIRDGETLESVLQRLELNPDAIEQIRVALTGIDELSDQIRTTNEQLQQMQLPADLGGTLEALHRGAISATSEFAGLEEQIRGVGQTGQETLTDLGAGIQDTQSALTDVERRLQGLETSTVIGADIRRALTRPQMAELEGVIQNSLLGVIEELEFDPEEFSQAQSNVIENRFKNARERLGRQFGIDPGGPKTGQAQRQFELLESARIEELNTLDAQVQDRIENVRQNTLAGLTSTLTAISNSTLQQQELAQRAEEFDRTMRLRFKEFGLTEAQSEAAIRQVNSEIENNTRRNSAEIGQRWAEITGRSGTAAGKVSVQDLGVVLPDTVPFGPPDIDSPTASAVRASFESMMGRAATNVEVQRLMSGQSVNVDSMPTLESRELAANMALQNMERIAKYDAIANQLELDQNKFLEATEQTDRQWSLTTLDVAEQFGLDQDKFRSVKYVLDSEINSILLRQGPDRAPISAAERSRLVEEATNKALARFPDEQHGAFLQANDLFDRVYGDQKNAIARAAGMDAERFDIGLSQAQQQEDRMLAAWAGIMAVGDVETQRADSTNQQPHRDFVDRVAGVFGDIELIRSPSGFVRDWLQTVDASTKEEVREMFEQRFRGFFPDDKLLFSLTELLKARKTGSYNFSYQNIAHDWINRLRPNEIQVFMALINGSYSPERGGGESSFLGSVGRALGIGAGAIIGGIAGGAPGATVGAQAGAAITA